MALQNPLKVRLVTSLYFFLITYNGKGFQDMYNVSFKNM
jgi:hypothetical protein